MHHTSTKQSNPAGVAASAAAAIISLTLCLSYAGAPRSVAYAPLWIPAALALTFGLIHLTVWMVLFSLKLHSRAK